MAAVVRAMHSRSQVEAERPVLKCGRRANDQPWKLLAETNAPDAADPGRDRL